MTDQGPPPSASDHPPTWTFDMPIYHAETRAAWRAWLAAHHLTERGVWLATWKSATGRPAVPYPDAVEEAICVGWIDSTVNRLDDERNLQLMTPRKPRSSWTRLNRERVDRMEAAGLMTDAGRRAVEVAKANGWWMRFDAVEDLIEPEGLARALDAVPAARASWDAFPPSARKQMLWWVVSAARDDTRARRVAAIVDAAREGRRAQG
ncbi:YdeI family protein [Euzebya sp.]|uniref:YdeI/OmpD-associated family protein n=1 Tax=Euzebya sp. TaxID=1971409 RepID=UPI003519BC2D